MELKFLKQKLESQNRQIIEIEHRKFEYKSEEDKQNHFDQQISQIEKFEESLNPNNFRNLLEHLIQENEKILQVSEFQIEELEQFRSTIGSGDENLQKLDKKIKNVGDILKNESKDEIDG